MSQREELQQRIVAALEKNTKFNAPYGIIPSLHTLKKGKVRTIAFGVARYLDATMYIWSSNKIVVDGRGGLAYKLIGVYSSEQDLITAINNF